MTHRDLLINAMLLLLIGGMAYLLATFAPADLEAPPARPKAAEPEKPVVVDTTYIGPSKRDPSTLAFVRGDPFKDIVKRTPAPTQPPPTPPPPPPLKAVFDSTYKVVLVDPPKSAMVQETKPPQQMITWKVGAGKDIVFNNQTLHVTLSKVNMNDFSATFTTPGQEPYVVKIFGP